MARLDAVRAVQIQPQIQVLLDKVMHRVQVRVLSAVAVVAAAAGVVADAAAAVVVVAGAVTVNHFF